jgi:hypothetical protein
VNARQPRRLWATLARNSLILVAALVIALLVCELALRMLGISYPVFVWTDPVRGVAHIPGVSGGKLLPDGHRWVEINSDGWRGPDVPLEPTPGTLRIALLGDSFIEAFEVPFDSTVGEVVERRLSALRGRPVEVLNFGEGGYGTTQEYLTLQHEVWKYSPDVVLLAVTTGNDISDNSRRLRRGNYVPYQVFQGDRLVLDTSFVMARDYRSRTLWTRRMLGLVKHSRLAQLINRVRHLRVKGERQQANAGGDEGDELGLRDEVQLPPATPDWQEAWRVTEGVLGLMRDECRRHGVPFAVVTLSRGIQVTPDTVEKRRFLQQLGAKDLYYPERRIADLGQREGIPVLNLAPSMAEEAERRHVYFHAHGDSLGVGHWNVAGHQAAGERIAAWLAKLTAAESAAAK